MLELDVLIPPKGAKAKAFGAYYTDRKVADFLVRWAIRTPTDTVMDPSFGGGVFLEAALKRSKALGGASHRIYGVEIDERTHAQVAYELSLLYGVKTKNLIRSDFFKVDKKRFKPLGAIVGNPPFIRYQSFSGENRQRALRRAEEEGVKLSKLVSSWVPFLVHSCALLKEGGRLAMVIPAELGHAAYARPVLKYLAKNFGRITLLTFRERLFPELSQDTLLLLAEGKGERSGKLFLQDLAHMSELENADEVIRKLSHAEEISAESIVSGQRTLPFYWLGREARAMYERLEQSHQTKRLGELTEVGIGYVTGANHFFHLSREEVEARGITPRYLTRAVYRSRALSGLYFSPYDWIEAEEVGEAGYLFNVPPEEGLSNPVNAYLAEGERQEVHRAYKCRVRSPWYSVPHVYKPDALLTYMSGLRPSLAANDAGAVAPNSLHVVRLRPQTSLSARDLALLWQTSLTSLSVELEGRALGGGLLKLEPSEAKSVLIACPKRTEMFETAFGEVDRLLRGGQRERAREVADEVILERSLGFCREEVRTLREAADLLRDRRYYKGKAAPRRPTAPLDEVS